jgi:hypothetical protein
MIIAEYSVEIAIAVEVGDGRIMRSAFRRGGFRDWGLRCRGGIIAKELSTAGFQVVVLEQGPFDRIRWMP